MIERIEQSSREVATPMTFSTLIIGVAFLPLFTMTGVSGVIFAPMARTYAFAIGGAILPRAHAHAGARVEVRARRSPRRRRASSCASSTRSTARRFDLAMQLPEGRARLQPRAHRRSASPSSRCSGASSCRKLEEGNFWIRATLPMSISLDQSAKYVGRMRSHPARLPDGRERRRATTRTASTRRSRRVVSQLGRPDDGTDVSGFYNIEFFAPLKPFDEWPRGRDQGEADRADQQGAVARRSPASSSTSRSTSRTTSRRPSAA